MRDGKLRHGPIGRWSAVQLRMSMCFGQAFHRPVPGLGRLHRFQLDSWATARTKSPWDNNSHTSFRFHFCVTRGLLRTLGPLDVLHLVVGRHRLVMAFAEPAASGAATVRFTTVEDLARIP